MARHIICTSLCEPPYLFDTEEAEGKEDNGFRRAEERNEVKEPQHGKSNDQVNVNKLRKTGVVWPDKIEEKAGKKCKMR